MNKKKTMIVLIAILVIVLIANGVEILNNYKNAATFNSQKYVMIYSMLTIAFASLEEKEKKEAKKLEGEN